MTKLKVYELSKLELDPKANYLLVFNTMCVTKNDIRVLLKYMALDWGEEAVRKTAFLGVKGNPDEAVKAFQIPRGKQ